MNIDIDSFAACNVRYLAPLAKFIIFAIVVEFIANRKTRDWNFWVSFMCGITVMFRLYLLAWITTIQPYNLQSEIDASFFRDAMLIKLFLFLMTSFFVPISALALGKVWTQQKKCGVTQSLARLVPILGMIYLFVRSFLYTVNFVNSFNLPI
jgi:hypothetical protein